MTPRQGQYHYEMFRGKFRVMVCSYVSPDGLSSTFDPVTDFTDREAAKDFVYKMNGWKRSA